MSINSLTVNGVLQSGNTFQYTVPNNFVGQDTSAKGVVIMSYTNAPGGVVTGGSLGCRIESKHSRPTDGTGRWYQDGGQTNVISAVGDVTSSDYFRMEYVFSGRDYRWTVTDDRNEPVDVVIEISVHKDAH